MRSEVSPRTMARLAGLLYLIVIVGGAFAELGVRGRLVVSGDAGATAQNILAHEVLYRAGLAIEIFYLACNVPITLLIYELFKVVNRRVALLVVFFSLVGTAVEGAALLAHYAPLLLLGGSSYLSAFTPEQLQAAAYLSLQMFERGFALCLVFFGFFCMSFGYLIARSRFFPRVIGVLLAIQGVCYLINSFLNFLAPAVAPRFFPVLAVSAVGGEFSLCFWLLVKGVNPERWREQAAGAASSG